MSSQTGGDTENAPPSLSPRQKKIFSEKINRFEDYLRSKGKNPRKEIGYAEDSIDTRISRVLRGIHWIWRTEGRTTELTAEQADQIIEALEVDDLRRQDGGEYSENSKRKISNALVNWFRFNGSEWEPSIAFTDELPEENSDPFFKRELRLLWQTSLNYKNIPQYKNISPEERDRWRAHLAQELGKPKDEVRPADWEAINKSWKIPSLIRTTRSGAWRPALVGRMKVSWYDSDAMEIRIPGADAVKNNSDWTQELPEEAVFSLDQWLEQRANQPKYDDTDAMWLTRKQNPYSSNSLNYLLDNLIEQAGIKRRGRKLTWYSFRHSLGTYVYDEYQDLEIVAEMLRQNSTASASCYVHPTPELKREAARIT